MMYLLLITVLVAANSTTDAPSSSTYGEYTISRDSTTRSSPSSTTTEAPSTQNSDDSSHENRPQDGQEENSRNPSVKGIFRISCQVQSDCDDLPMFATCCNQPGGVGGTCWFGASCDSYCKVDENCSYGYMCYEGKCHKGWVPPNIRPSPSSTTTEALSAENSDDSSYDATTRSSSSSTTDAPSSSTYGNHSTQSDYSSSSDSTTQNLGFDFQTQNDGPRALII